MIDRDDRDAVSKRQAETVILVSGNTDVKHTTAPHDYAGKEKEGSRAHTYLNHLVGLVIDCGRRLIENDNPTAQHRKR